MLYICPHIGREKCPQIIVIRGYRGSAIKNWPENGNPPESKRAE
jgi:hypothetical protein